MPDFEDAIAQQNEEVGNVPPSSEDLTENQKRAVKAHTGYHKKMASLAKEGSGKSLHGGGLTLRVK